MTERKMSAREQMAYRTIAELEAKLAQLSADFQATVDHMNEGCICGRAPDPKHPVDPRLKRKPNP